MLYLGIFEMEYLKAIVTFEISKLEFLKLREKRKNPKFGTKNALFHFFFFKLGEKTRHICNEQPRTY